jgi:serine/threonine-protein kinase
MAQEVLNRIGEYELKEKLGQGGYGAVYKARDSLGRDVAIKVLTAFGDDSSTIEGFKKEATTLAKLNHRNIVTVYQFGVDQGKPFLAMEYLQGQPLSAIIKSRREMHLVEKLDVIIQATEGLKHAHENKVIHRDIKPHNLMVVENSIVKLIDFGIAQGDGSKSQSRQEIAGSLPYMSPEHFVQKRTPWCDIFSMGVVLYELLTGGQVPYASDRDDLPVAYHKLMSNDPAPPLSTYVQDLPPGLEEVVGKAISKQKLNGYDTAEEFVFELSRVQDIVKGDFVAQLLKAVESAAAAQDYRAAHDLVERILRVDPNNVPAKRKQFELKKFVQAHQRNEQLHAICVRVEEAISSKKFDLAQLGLEEARQMDPNSNTVKMLQSRLVERRELQSKIEALISEAQKYGSAGNWNPAEQAVDSALELEASNTRALEFRDAIRRAVAQESRIVEQAQVALKELRFQEAFELIRQAEAIAPQSERVNALKELAVNAYKEDERKREVAAATQTAKDLAAQKNFTGAREQLDQALSKYSDERSLLELRAEIEKQQEELAKQQFVEEKLHAGDQAFRAKSYVDAIAILEQASRRVPDQRLFDLLAKAKEKAQAQVAEKRRDQYLKSAKESMAREDAASAVVTMEMAQAEFGAEDQQVKTLLEEARAAAEVQAKAAAEREEQERKEAERKAKEAAERQEISSTIANATASAQHGDFPAALKFIEQAAGKYGMRPELANAANEIRAARTAHATAQIETIVEHAFTEAESQHFPGALQALERAKSLTEFASEAAVQKLANAEQRIRKAQQELDNSATKIFQKSGATPVPARGADAQVVRPSASGSHGAAAAAAPAPVKPAAPSAPAARAKADTGVRRVPVVEPPPPSSKMGLIIAIAAVVVLVAAVGVYLMMSPSTVNVTFQADPDGSVVAVNGATCTSPCSMKLKPGQYKLKATHDNYTALEQDLDVTAKTGTVPLKLAAFGTATVAATGTLALDISVAGADIFVDDQLKDTAKGKKDNLTVTEGSHQVRVQAQNYQPLTQSVTVNKDAQATLSFNLVAGAGSTPAQAYVILTSVPNAKVVVDGKQVGTVGADRKFSAPVDPGRHSVQVSLDGYQPAPAKNFNAKDGQKVPLTLNLLPLKTAIASFTADKTDIQAGQSVVLKWEAQNATDVSIDNGVGAGPASGTKTVSPTATTTYNIIANGPGGKSPAQRVTIKVAAAAAAAAPPPPTVAAKPAPSILNFDLGSDSIREGEKGKLIWSTQNADNVTIEPEVGQQKPNGSVSVSPSKTTTYVLTAHGPGGDTKSQSLTLTVEAKQQAAAPQQAAPTQATPAAPDDSAQIKDVLEHEWAGAFNSKNLGAAKNIWPSIPGNLQDAVRNSQGVKISLSCSPQVSGDKATARCSQSNSLNGKSLQGSNVVFSLSKAGGNWKIDSSR